MYSQLRPLIVMSILGALCAGLLADDEAFEVLSIKPAKMEIGGYSERPRRSGSRLTWNTSPQQLIIYAFSREAFLIEGLDRVPMNQLYQIQAITVGSPTDDQLRKAFQSVLHNRFGLLSHWATKETSGYDLVVAKGGATLDRWSPDSPPVVAIGKTVAEGVLANYSTREDPKNLVGHRVTMSELAARLSAEMKQPVFDKTGLAGWFNVRISWHQDDDRPFADADPGILGGALRKQLGLQLVKTRAAVQYLVVDKIASSSTEN